MCLLTFITILGSVSLCSSNNTNNLTILGSVSLCSSNNTTNCTANSTVHLVTSSPADLSSFMKSSSTATTNSVSRSSSLSSGSTDASSGSTGGSTDASSVTVLPTPSSSSEKPPTKDPSTNNIIYLSVGIAGIAAFACSLVLCVIACIMILLAKKGRLTANEDPHKKMASTKCDGLEMEDLSGTQNHEIRKAAGTNEDLNNQKAPSINISSSSEEDITKQTGEPGNTTEGSEKPSEALSKSLDMDKQSIARSESSQVLEVEVDGKFYGVDVATKLITVSDNQRASLDGNGSIGLGDNCCETAT